jgi:hypothetical protein
MAFVGALRVHKTGVLMRMHSFRCNPSDWKPLYEAALLETDSSKLPQRITLARTAILDRIEESLAHPIPGEHRAMDEALRHLRRLTEMTLPSRAAA